MKKVVLILLVLVVTATTGYTGELPSKDQGKMIFESTGLGSNGKSCATCHPGGKKLEWAATFEDERLVDIVNRCIVSALKGKALDENSTEMKSLILYMKTFAGP